MKPSFSIGIWAITTITQKGETRYRVRWRVGPSSNEFHESFSNYDLALGRRSELLTAKNSGEPFDLESGLPLAEARAREEQRRIAAAAQPVTVFSHLLQVTDRRWDNRAANTRRSRAEAHVDITMALLPRSRSHRIEELRAALRWAYNTKRRRHEPCPPGLAPALAWIEAHSPDITALADDDTVLTVLAALSRTLDGSPAAPTTFARKRAAFNLALQDAVGRGKPLDRNPLPDAERTWTGVYRTNAIDPGIVVNPQQAIDLLDAVASCGPMGERLEAFFAAMYYSGLRPGEAVRLQQENLTSAGQPRLRIWQSAPTAGSDWTDSGHRRDDRHLKHRAVNDFREPPYPPDLQQRINQHLTRFGTRPDGRLFRGMHGGDLSDSITSRIWAKARRKVLTADELNTGLARRPYDLRHACLSLWLTATSGDATRVAAWAGNSVRVLLDTYAKCLAGRDNAARELVNQALHTQRQP